MSVSLPLFGKKAMSNAPHYITEIEAAKKICPMSVGGGMNNRILVIDGLEAGRACIAANCMAWRWKYDWKEDGEEEGHYSLTLGYCGMVCG